MSRILNNPGEVFMDSALDKKPFNIGRKNFFNSRFEFYSLGKVQILSRRGVKKNSRNKMNIAHLEVTFLSLKKLCTIILVFKDWKFRRFCKYLIFEFSSKILISPKLYLKCIFYYQKEISVILILLSLIFLLIHLILKNNLITLIL